MFVRKRPIFLQVAIPFAFPPAMYESSICSTYMFSEKTYIKETACLLNFMDKISL